MMIAAPLRGTAGDDGLAARWDGDRVFGLGGDDRLASLFNNTGLFGGAGNDRLLAELPSVDEPDAPMRLIEMDGGTGDDRLVVTRSYDDAADFPDFATTYRHLLEGGRGNDSITVRASTISGFDTIETFADGGDGDDQIRVSVNTPDLPRDIWSTSVTTEIDGGEGDDSLMVNAFSGADGYGADIRTSIAGEGGRDFISATTELAAAGDAEGEVEIDGGSGDDSIDSTLEATFNVSAFSTPIVASHTVTGGTGDDRLGVTTLYDNEFGECVTRALGGSGDDELVVTVDVSGPRAEDIDTLLDGGSGNDRLELTMESASQAVLRGSTGADAIVVVLTTARGSVRAVGGSGNDTLTVSGGRRNWLDGGAGEDEIQGGSRSDTIIGGFGDDALSGGAGADRFVYGAEWGRDTITDFGRSEDVLVFETFTDSNGNGLVDELDQAATIEDQGVGGDVVVEFSGTDKVTFSGLGTGEVDSFADLVDDPSTQRVAGMLV